MSPAIGWTCTSVTFEKVNLAAIFAFNLVLAPIAFLSGSRAIVIRLLRLPLFDLLCVSCALFVDYFFFSAFALLGEQTGQILIGNVSVRSRIARFLKHLELQMKHVRKQILGTS